MTRSTVTRSDRWLLGLLVLFSAAVACTPLLLRLPVTWDDGFYYLEIARRLAAGEGSTFDGINPTNGYHPLWLLTLVALFGIASSAEGSHRLRLEWSAAMDEPGFEIAIFRLTGLVDYPGTARYPSSASAQLGPER